MAPEDHPEGRRERGRPPKPITPEKSALSRLGRALRQAREAAGLSLAEFAKITEYSAGHLSRVEHGQVSPSWELVEAYERRFHADGLLRAYYQMVLDEQAGTRRRLREMPKQAILREGDETDHPPPATRPGDRSEFVCDVTIADGELVEPGATMTKIWRLRNAGTVSWHSRKLERVGAHAGGPGSIASQRQVEFEDTEPGEMVEVAADLTMPPLPGTTIAYWQMVEADGTRSFPDRYADCLYCKVVVRAGAAVAAGSER